MPARITIYCAVAEEGPSRNEVATELAAFFGGAAAACGAGGGYAGFALDYELADGEDPHAWTDRLRPFLAGLGVRPGARIDVLPTVREAGTGRFEVSGDSPARPAAAPDPPRGGQRRAHYRVRFPPPDRPALLAGGAAYPVAELSEGGCRLVAPPGGGPAAGQPFAATLSLPGGQEVAVEGAVVRAEGGELVVRFAVGVGLPAIVRLQRALARKYPDLFRPGPPAGS